MLLIDSLILIVKQPYHDPLSDFRPRDLKVQQLANHVQIRGTFVAVGSERSARTIRLHPKTAAFASSACLVMSATPARVYLLHARQGHSTTVHLQAAIRVLAAPTKIYQGRHFVKSVRQALSPQHEMALLRVWCV